MNIGFVSYSVACVAFLVLTALLVTTWRGRLSGFLLIQAVVATTLWAGTSAIFVGYGTLSELIVQLTEFLRDAGWFFFLLNILVSNKQHKEINWNRHKWIILGAILLAVGTTLTISSPFIIRYLGLTSFFDIKAFFLPWLVLSIVGLMLVEQIFRNSRPEKRWNIKHLTIGVGGLFVYDFYMYADATLFLQLDPDLWNARGFVIVLVVPLIAVSAARNPDWTLKVHVSRHVVFYSTTLVGTGLYLLAMAGAGYYVRHYGGSWGAILQIAFLFGGGVILLLILFSGQIRSRLRLFLSKHFFNYKYDYREEWLHFTNALAVPDDSLAEAIVGAMAKMVGSTGGSLWVRGENNGFELSTNSGMPMSKVKIESENGPLVQYLERSGWLVDIGEYEFEPEIYAGLEIPSWLQELTTAWIVVPLFFKDKLQAFAVLARPRTNHKINWEDRDLLKTAGNQAASHIAQHQVAQALIQSRQFEAFNQLSAYVIHDLKNILAQHALIVANAEKYKHNPEFVDDIVKTLRNSVGRMNRLMEQLRSGIRGAQKVPVQMDLLLKEVIDRRSKQQPVPRAEQLEPSLVVYADKERLATVFAHIIQNAQEATRSDGSVLIRLSRKGGSAIIEIRDNGVGMTPEFIRERLFRPFESTKGLTGMGIGAFECREMVQALGGGVFVDSRPGVGTVFRISVPCRNSTGTSGNDLRVDLEVVH